jgi:drug/metabolite transporter (DMT)-like permease
MMYSPVAIKRKCGLRRNFFGRVTKLITRARGTAFGALAIAAWSGYGALLASNRLTPPFMSMAVVFTSAALTLLLWRIIKGQGLRGLFPMPASTLALGFLGLFGSNVLYPISLALGGAPVSVNIAALSWPVFMAVFIVLFRVAPATWLDGLAMAVGFAGVILLATKGAGLALDWAVLPAFIGALCWAALSALRTKVPAGPRDAMLHFVTVSAAACWLIVSFYEGWMTPPADELMRLVVIGALPVGLANYLWDLATRYGDPVLLAGMSFLEPVASTALIAVLLSKPVTWSDAGALGLILVAVLCSIMSERLRRRSANPQPAVSPS